MSTIHPHTAVAGRQAPNNSDGTRVIILGACELLRIVSNGELVVIITPLAKVADAFTQTFIRNKNTLKDDWWETIIQIQRLCCLHMSIMLSNDVFRDVEHRNRNINEEGRSVLLFYATYRYTINQTRSFMFPYEGSILCNHLFEAPH
jgi:hypothetical protein